MRRFIRALLMIVLSAPLAGCERSGSNVPTAVDKSTAEPQPAAGAGTGTLPGKTSTDTATLSPE